MAQERGVRIPMDEEMTTLLHSVGELITNDPAADDLLGS